MRERFESFACACASWFATPVAIILVPAACVAWLWTGFAVDTLTLALSILAISMTQLVLVGQGRGEALMQAKLNELVHAVPEADNSIADDQPLP